MVEYEAMEALEGGQREVNYDLCGVAELIKKLYLSPADASKASEALKEFQTSAEAWDISILLLTYCIPNPSTSSLLMTFCNGLPKEQLDTTVDEDIRSIVSFFAAETINTLCQLGFSGGNQRTFTLSRQLYRNESGLALVQTILKEFLAAYSSLSRIYRQTLYKLCQASSACLLFSFLEMLASVSGHLQSGISEVDAARVLLGDFIKNFSESPVLFLSLLDILGSLPTDLLQNKKLALTADQRETILSNLLHSMGDIFNTVCGIHEYVTCHYANENGESQAYFLVTKRWQLLRSKHSTPSILSGVRLLEVLEDVSWYQTLMNNLILNPKACERVDPMKYFRRSILSCFSSWIEASVSCRQRLSQAQSSLPQNEPTMGSLCDTMTPSYDIVVGSTLDDARFLLQSDMLRIFLMNFIFSVHMFVDTASTSCEVEDPQKRQVVFSELETHQSGLTPEQEEEGSLLHTVTNSLCELIELLFCMYSLHSPDTLATSSEQCQQFDQTYLLSLINWTNFEPLVSIFYTVAHVDSVVRRFCNGSTSLDSSLCGTKVSQIPRLVLQHYLTFMVKFADIFLPAMIYMVQNHTFNSTDFQPPASFLPCESLTLLASPDYGVTQPKYFLSQAKSIFYTLVDLLQHPSLDIRQLVLEFWSSLVGNQFIVQQAQLELSTPQENYRSQSTPSYNVVASDYQNLHEPFVVSCFDALVNRIIDLAHYPQNLKDLQTTFPFSAWIKFRDDASVALTNVTMVLPIADILEKLGKRLLVQLEQLKVDTSFATSRQIELCLFFLASLASRVQSTHDPYIPHALNALASLPYHQEASCETFVMIIAASKLIMWTSGYIGTQKTLFSTCFQLLESFLPQLISLSCLTTRDRDTRLYGGKTEFEIFTSYTERVVIEAMNCLTTASASTLVMDATVPESDITFILHGLAKSVLLTQLTMESRCSLIISAGAILQCLSISKMQKYHYQITKALQTQVMGEITQQGKLTRQGMDYLKLLFTSLESVQPIECVPLPPYSHNAVPLEGESEYRHPVLNVVEEFWDLLEQCLLEFHDSETVISSVCHCITGIFSKYPYHAVRYVMFQRFFYCLSQSFLKTPSIFHLAALRSMAGCFGKNREEPVIRSLVECLLGCTKAILDAIETTNAHAFMSESPDVVGMTLDCMNTALTFPPLACQLLEHPFFYDVLLLCINLTPQCPHPKVLMTMLLLLTRFTAWLNPSHLMESSRTTVTFQESRGLSPNDKNQIYWKCSEKAKNFSESLHLIQKIVTSAIRVLTESFHGNAQWIGIIATLLVELLETSDYASLTKDTIRVTLQTGPCTQINTTALNDFYDCLDAPKTVQTHPFMCRALQQLANHAEILTQRREFSQLTTP